MLAGAAYISLFLINAISLSSVSCYLCHLCFKSVDVCLSVIHCFAPPVLLHLVLRRILWHIFYCLGVKTYTLPLLFRTPIRGTHLLVSLLCIPSASSLFFNPSASKWHAPAVMIILFSVSHSGFFSQMFRSGLQGTLLSDRCKSSVAVRFPRNIPVLHISSNASASKVSTDSRLLF